jgi:hypothetical protein
MRCLTALSFALLLCTSSCATIFTGTRDEILFTSEPSEVKIIMDGYTVGKTPIMLDVRRSLNGRWVAFEKEGYERQYVKLETGFNAVSIINLTCLICWAVDLATGAVTQFTMPSLYVEMEPALEGRNTEGGKQ